MCIRDSHGGDVRRERRTDRIRTASLDDIQTEGAVRGEKRRHTSRGAVTVRHYASAARDLQIGAGQIGAARGRRSARSPRPKNLNNTKGSLRGRRGRCNEDNRNTLRRSHGTVSYTHLVGCPVIVSPGNHDPYTHGSIWEKIKMPDNVKVFSSDVLQCFSFPELNTDVYAVSYTHLPSLWRSSESDRLRRFLCPTERTPRCV